jgi:hypothetical protein
MGGGAGIGLGLLAGGLLGAAARPAAVYAYWLPDADPNLRQPILLVSAGIGMAVGVVAVLLAGLARRTWASTAIGVLSGSALAYLATILTFLPLLWAGLFGIGGIRTMNDEAPAYGVAMAFTGALSGGCGAILRSWLSGRRAAPASGP